MGGGYRYNYELLNISDKNIEECYFIIGKEFGIKI